MELRVAAIQLGPYKGTYDSQLNSIETLVTKVVKEHAVDIVCLPELMTTPYFARSTDLSWRNHAESVPNGSTAERISNLAQELACHIIGTCYERREQKYFNSAFLINPQGILEGTYSKVHIPRINSLATDEKRFFDAGSELPLFSVAGIPIGILICYDRSFPEAWRTLALKGAQVIFVPSSSSGFRGDLFVEELKVAASWNQLFVVGVNKAGTEFINGEPGPKTFYGRSSIIDPYGKVLTGLNREENSYIVASLNLDDIKSVRKDLPYYQDRCLKAYTPYLLGDL